MRSGHAGLFLFLFAAGLGLASQTCGRLGDRFGERPFVTLGFSATLVTSTCMAMLNKSTPLSLLALVVFANGVAMGTWSVPNNSILMGALPRSMLGVAGAVSNLTRNVGSVLGQAIASAVVAASMVTRGFDVALDEIDETPGAGAAFINGWQNAFVVAVGLGATGLVLSFATRPRRVA
jgi:MFS family permease